MIIDGQILVQGIDKDFFQDKFEIFHNNYKKISCVISFEPLKPKYNISYVDRIDLSCLYNLKTIKNAFNINYTTELDIYFLNLMMECQVVFFSTIDRCCAVPLSMSTHRNYFYELLYFFKSFFENRKDIKNVFFSTTPHFPVDIVLFYVAKYFSINIIILTRTDFNNQFFFRNDWRIVHYFENNITYNDKKFKIKIDKDSKFLEYGKNLNKLSINNLFNNNHKKNYLKHHYNLIKHTINVYKNKNIISSLFLNHNINFFIILKIIYKRYKVNYKLFIKYSNLSVHPTFTNEYVYFPLHFQPERSTDPEGLFFSNQLIALELLRNSIPKNIIIYVKEHPRQFDPLTPDLRKLHTRYNTFYEKIVNLPNTFLVNINIDSNLLIINSKIVATITGSAGWEAMLRGKPVFVFGRPWYSSCKSCYIINDGIDIVNAINIIENIKKEQFIDNVNLFITNIEGKTFDAFIGSVYFEGNNDFYNELINSFAKNLNNYISSLNYNLNKFL
jgi:hypothetical protein